MRCQLDKKKLYFSNPVVTASGTLTERTSWIVTIIDEAGRKGFGEAAPLPGFGGEAPERCLQAIRSAMKLMTKDFFFNWMTRGRADALLGKMELELSKAPCARSAIEGAMIDLLAQRSGKPITEILEGPESRPSPRVNILLVADNVDRLEDEALSGAENGFTSFKMKLGADVENSVRRVIAVRDAIGPDSRLRVDVNGAWSAEQAASFIDQARDAQVEFVEQPLRAADLQGLTALRRQTGASIAVDESIREPADVARVVAAQAADVVVLKPMFLGGWRPTLQAAEFAKAHGLGVVVTTALDGCIGRAHATHMAAALACDAFAHGLATGHLFCQDLTTEPLAAKGGCIPLRNTPGLGIGDRI